jgi:hypothetical protein
MKLALAALALCVSSSAMASGKLTLKPAHESESGDNKYTLGLSVYERVGDLAAKVWLGGGASKESADNWYKGDVGTEYYMGPLAVGGGFTYETTPARETTLSEIYGTVSLTLW